MQEIEAPPSGGYLFIQDDAPFSHCMIPRYNKSQVFLHILCKHLWQGCTERPTRSLISSERAVCHMLGSMNSVSPHCLHDITENLAVLWDAGLGM